MVAICGAEGLAGAEMDGGVELRRRQQSQRRA
jgi:hypothetical protein